MNLADVYSFIDSKKRAVKGLLAEPGLTLQQYISQIGEDNDKRLNLQANAYPMAGDKTVLNSPHQLDQFRAQLAKEGSDMAMAGMFVGPSSKTWDKVSAQKATQMEKSGADARKIWSDTGTWKAPDGMWRQEIDDSKSQFVSQFPKPDSKEMNSVFAAQDLVRNTDALKRDARAAGGFTIPGFYADKPGLYDQYVSAKNLLGEYESKYVAPTQKSGILEKFVTHDDLYDAYPALSRVPTSHNKNHSGGMYSENAGNMLIGGGNEQSIAMHEIQHAVQQREGFSRGGMPEIMPDLLNSLANGKQSEANKMYKLAYSGDPLNTNEVLKPGALKRSLAAEKTATDYRAQASRAESFPSFAHDAYMRLAGEAEARATQTRIPLDAAQRRATFPEDSYDTPIGQLIMRFQSQ